MRIQIYGRNNTIFEAWLANTFLACTKMINSTDQHKKAWITGSEVRVHGVSLSRAR